MSKIQSGQAVRMLFAGLVVIGLTAPLGACATPPQQDVSAPPMKPVRDAKSDLESGPRR